MVKTTDDEALRIYFEPDQYNMIMDYLRGKEKFMVKILKKARKSGDHALELIDNRFKGHLFVFEGQDGVGKTTIMKQVSDALKVKGFGNIECYREPTRQTPESEKILKLIGDKDFFKQPDADAQLRPLYQADRMYNVKENLIPALERGAIVLQDRYFHSTAVYQRDKKLSMKDVLEYNRVTCKVPEPDLTFIFKVPPSELVTRNMDYNPQDHNEFDDPLRYEHLNKAYELLIATDTEGKYCVVYNMSQLLSVRTITDVIAMIVKG